MIKVEINQHECKRCNHKWLSKLDSPVACPKCKRVNWHQERTPRKYEAVYSLQPGESVVIPWPERLGGPHPVVQVIRRLRARGVVCRVEFRGDGAHVARVGWKPEPGMI